MIFCAQPPGWQVTIGSGWESFGKSNNDFWASTDFVPRMSVLDVQTSKTYAAFDGLDMTATTKWAAWQLEVFFEEHTTCITWNYLEQCQSNLAAYFMGYTMLTQASVSCSIRFHKRHSLSFWELAFAWHQDTSLSFMWNMIVYHEASNIQSYWRSVSEI